MKPLDPSFFVLQFLQNKYMFNEYYTSDIFPGLVEGCGCFRMQIRSLRTKMRIEPPAWLLVFVSLPARVGVTGDGLPKGVASRLSRAITRPTTWTRLGWGSKKLKDSLPGILGGWWEDSRGSLG